MVMIGVDGNAFAFSAIFVCFFASYIFAEIDTYAFLTLFICAFAFHIFASGIARAGFIAAVFAFIQAFTFARAFIT